MATLKDGPGPNVGPDEQYYKVTIKYIDNDENILLYSLNFKGWTEKLKFPQTSSIKEKYALDGTKLKIYFGIDGYQLIGDKVIIDDEIYTVDNMPVVVKTDKNHTIKFYYTKINSEANVVVRTFIVNKKDDNITSIINQSIKKFHIDAGEEQSYQAPTIEEHEYIGYHFQKNLAPLINADLLNDLDPSQTEVEYILENGETAYIDFFYLNQEYTDIKPDDDTNDEQTTNVEPDEKHYKVTVNYIDNDEKKVLYSLNFKELIEDSTFPDVSNIKEKYALDGKALKIHFGIDGYELMNDKTMIDRQTYTIDSMPLTIKMNKNRIINFYYTKSNTKARAVIRTFIVSKKDDTIMKITNNSITNLEINTREMQTCAAPVNENYEYMGCYFQKNTPPLINTSLINSLEPNQTKVEYSLENGETAYIDFYYLEQEYTYKVKIKYIDDDAHNILYEIDNIDKLDSGSLFPKEQAIKDKYLVRDMKGTYGIDGYELREDKVSIDNQIYNLNNMPSNLIIDSDKFIEFYYRRKNTNANIRTFIVTKIDGITVGVRNYSSNSHSAYPDINYEETAPNINSYTYIGYAVRYDELPTITSSTINNLDSSERIAKYKLSTNNNKAYIDFFYLEEYNTVTVKYQDEYGNQIESDVSAIVKKGETYIPNVPSTISKYEMTYDYINRSDGKSQNANIGPINQKTVVIMKYKVRGYRVIIRYKDILTNSDIPPYMHEENDVAPNSLYMPDENGVPSEYTFVKRSDGLGRKASINVGTSNKEVTFYYVKLEQGKPIVSYPTIENEVLLGKNTVVTIRANGLHTQMYNYGIAEPTGGWNAKYAKSEYLMFDCDVIYNGVVQAANTPFRVAINNSGYGISTTSVDIVIPEYVREGEYTLTAIVSNVNLKNGNTSLYAGYNMLYGETEAVNTLKFKVVGKLYDFTISNLLGDNFWPTSAFNNINGYKASENATNKIAKLPIGQKRGQNTAYKNGIALGSSFFFNLNTLGVKNEGVKVDTKLMYLDDKGVAQGAEFYYKASNGQYVAMGENGLSSVLNADKYKVRTNLLNEYLKGTKLYGTGAYSTSSVSIGNQKQLSLDTQMRVPFVNYLSEEKTSTYQTIIKNASKEDDVLKAANHWYGRYSLPYTLKAVDEGKKATDQEKGNGFVVVLFKITSTTGNSEYLHYENQTVGNQWKNEDGAGNGENLSITLPVTSYSNGITTNIKVEDGYYPVAIYGYTPTVITTPTTSARLSYDTSGTH